MRIIARGFFALRKAMGGMGETEMVLESATLMELLLALCARYGPEFEGQIFDPEIHALRAENPILVNGRHYRNLPEGLDTSLKEGDIVAIFPPVAGG